MRLLTPCTTVTPDDKILALSKLKALANDNFIVAEIVLFLFEKVKKNLVETVKITGN